MLKRNKLKFKVIKNLPFSGKDVEGIIKTPEKVLNYFSLKKISAILKEKN